jgi:uncharacterized membrane protein
VASDPESPEPSADPLVWRGPRWPWVAGSLWSLLGLGVSGYLTYEHYTGSRSLTCPGGTTHGAIDCFKVTTSIYSMEHGVPVSVLGLVFFFVMAALQSAWAWRVQTWWMNAARIGWCVVGLASVLKLIYDELYKIDAICLWCTSVHVITFIVFVITVFGTLSWSARRAEANGY